MPSPMMKATLASAALSSASNVIAQILEAYRDGRPFALDVAMFLRFVAVAFVTAPPNYLWQQLLERMFPAHERKRPSAAASGGGNDPRDLEKQAAMAEKQPEAGAGPAARPKLNLRNTFSKWFIDCITLGALFNTVAFFVLMGALKGQPAAVIARNIRVETIPLIVAGYKIWPFASIISFSFIPVERRIVFLNFVGLLWGVYMSLVASRV
ncbi:putative mpv17 pmp22 family protein [Rosellinia necatrix]|uniref:Putative mpv17 pmp22 family protein n=1 Tax=Rosellinia necatrix TaxID=77044 RepID=A0A1W2THS6_ROSNE|nr:putative mpv17 pmp22 family protein [Rosellinia necatrix]